MSHLQSSQSQRKQVMSGLGAIKRDFSSNSVLSSSQTSSTSALRSKELSMDAQKRRLKAIEEALGQGHRSETKADRVGSTIPSSSQSNPWTSSSSSSQKRASPSDDGPAPKRRQLPSTWEKDKELTASSGFVKSGKKTVAKATGKSSKRSGSGKIELSKEQEHILNLVKEGNSVFYTGSAGTGKSVLLREIIKALKLKHKSAHDAVAVTASTGIAACNIGGVTVHSFAGIGIGEGNVDQLITRIRKNKKATSRWLRTKVLIIDEISMIDGDLFDKLSQIGSQIRHKENIPFGGIQVIVTGDFFQLPPVNKGSREVKFAFEADNWSRAIKTTFNLTQVFRQKDPEFVDMLNEMRFGRISQETIRKFNGLSREIEYEDGVQAAELFPRREDVDYANRTRMTGIKGAKERSYPAIDSGPLVSQDSGQKMLANFMAPQHITLKVGAQVMLIKNYDDTLVNGSMGTVVDIVDAATYAADPSHEDEVAPSTKDGSANGKPITSLPRGVEFPVVLFTSGRKMLVTPESWKVELPNGELQVARTQIPLILAWAMSIHKSQGQTLERVKVDLAKVFEKGQAYVALSRATSLEGLQVLNFVASKVNAHPKVVEWSKTLQTIEDS